MSLEEAFGVRIDEREQLAQSVADFTLDTYGMCWEEARDYVLANFDEVSQWLASLDALPAAADVDIDPDEERRWAYSCIANRVIP